MFTLYNLFKFLHVAAVIVWVGGVIALAVVNTRLARETSGAAFDLLSRQSELLGRAVLGPAAAVTLIAGFALVGTLGAGFTLWMAWGLIGVVGSVALGATVLRRAGQEMAALSAEARPDEGRMGVLRRRLALGGTLNIVLLLSTVWAMIFKPTL